MMPEREGVSSSIKSMKEGDVRFCSMKTAVVKVGSSTLRGSDGTLDRAYVQSIADQVHRLKQKGWRVILVSSAAIMCGLDELGIKRRPSDMPSLQAAASVGQCILSGAYAEAFASYDIVTSLVLLTRRDTADRSAYLHARDTLLKLLDFGVVPIVNENDTVSVEQIRFGDNDTLAALVSSLIGADVCVILSDIDGLYDANPKDNPNARLIPRVGAITPDILGIAGDAGSSVGSGGMVTKLKAARVLMAAGIPLVVCHGRAEDAIYASVADRSLGTVFCASKAPHDISARKLWIALGDSAHGSLIVDDGAKHALLHSGSSLLLVGISAVVGSFDVDDIVDIVDKDGYVFGRGRVSVESDLLSIACRLTREEVATNRFLSHLTAKPIVHRDESIMFE